MIVWIFAGQHGYRTALVSFLGLRNDVPVILPQMNAFIYSTEHDTFGIASLGGNGLPIFRCLSTIGAVMQEITGQGKYATFIQKPKG